MRWQNLFDDLESQLESELGAEEVDLLAEEERLRLGRLTLRDRVRAVHADAPASPLVLTLRGPERVSITVAAIGRDWIAGELDAGALRSAIVPLAAVSTLDPVGGQLAASLRLDPAPEPPTALSARLGLAFVLRDLCRRRAPVEIGVGGERWHGTIDRVGRDHLDLAEHAPGEPRRTASVSRIRIVAFAALDLVRF
ncbi:hypothetical protein [Pseudolysinimonas sp.]|jgi:hypothetical protein|uniref:hypothetical protein n=1 Tax=Pseudolysinimonas sp. TaxID=2680009 RepID=UPI0037845CE9